MRTLALSTVTVAWALAACGGSPDARTTARASSGASAGGATAEAAVPAGPGVATSPDSVPLSVSADIGGRRYQATGVGECVRELRGTVYDAPAEMWAARYSATGKNPLQRLTLVLWRLKDGSGVKTSLWLQIGEVSHQIATVHGGDIVGKATAELKLSGPGGALLVDGVDGDGESVRVTATCQRFVDNTEQNG